MSVKVSLFLCSSNYPTTQSLEGNDQLLAPAFLLQGLGSLAHIRQTERQTDPIIGLGVVATDKSLPLSGLERITQPTVW
jgi:hypothetical protein